MDHYRKTQRPSRTNSIFVKDFQWARKNKVQGLSRTRGHPGDMCTC